MIIEAGQVAVVTGAAQGLGHALATGLVDRGVSVVLADIAAERLNSTVAELSARNAAVLAVITDVSDAAAVHALACTALDHFGRVDMIVNNAGIATGDSRPLWQTDPRDWQRVLAVNLLGVVHGIQAFTPHLVTAGAGHVLNIASLAGLSTFPFGGAYSASKHAVVAISETLHRELEAMGLPIGVTVACPALVRTPMAEGLFRLAQADDDVLAERLPAHLSMEQLRASLQRMIANFLEPGVAAERILAAVETDRLYALTHGDFEDNVRSVPTGSSQHWMTRAGTRITPTCRNSPGHTLWSLGLNPRQSTEGREPQLERLRSLHRQALAGGQVQSQLPAVDAWLTGVNGLLLGSSVLNTRHDRAGHLHVQEQEDVTRSALSPVGFAVIPASSPRKNLFTAGQQHSLPCMIPAVAGSEWTPA